MNNLWTWLWMCIFLSISVKLVIDFFRSCNGSTDTLGYKIYLAFLKGFRS